MKKQLLFLLFSLHFLSLIANGRFGNESNKPKTETSVDEDIPVYRIELRLVTAGGKWDGTDNEVYIQLNNKDEDFYLDYGRDDFNRNAAQRFDLVSTNIHTIRDIQFIKFGVKKNDQWGIKKVELYLNNSAIPVYSSAFTRSVVINNHAGQTPEFIITSSELRANDKWIGIPANNGLKALPIPVKFATIKSIVESMVGNQLHHSGDKNLQWGSTDDVNTVWGDWVEGAYVNSTTLHFDLDLEYSISNSPDAEIDVKFDLVFSCENGNIVIKTANVKTKCSYLGIDCNTILKIVNTIVNWFGYDGINIDSEKYKNTFNQMFTIKAGENKCHNVIVGGGGDVVVL